MFSSFFIYIYAI